jgi:hypothetical protein
MVLSCGMSSSSNDLDMELSTAEPQRLRHFVRTEVLLPEHDWLEDVECDEEE